MLHTFVFIRSWLYTYNKVNKIRRVRAIRILYNIHIVYKYITMYIYIYIYISYTRTTAVWIHFFRHRRPAGSVCRCRWCANNNKLYRTNTQSAGPLAVTAAFCDWPKGFALIIIYTLYTRFGFNTCPGHIRLK